MEIGIKEIILEARAFDRRKDALNKGIIPINGSNWNADRKNSKKINQLLNLAKQSKIMDGELTDRKKISPNKEYAGIVNNNKLILDKIGTRKDVSGKFTFEDTFHKHPTINEFTGSRKEAAIKHFKNIPIATPSGKNSKSFNPDLVKGDFGVNAMMASLAPNNKSTEYIISPNTKSNTISKLSTTIMPDETVKNRLTFASEKAKKFYDLNGNLINGANDYIPTRKKLFFKDKDIDSKIEYLKAIKKSERTGFHNKDLDINKPDSVDNPISFLAKTYKQSGLNELRKFQPSLDNTRYLDLDKKSNMFSNESNNRFKNDIESNKLKNINNSNV